MNEPQVVALRKVGGYAPLPEFGLLKVSGRDAGRFLQAQTTNDVAALQPGQGQLNCLIDRTAHVQSLFSLHFLGGAYWLILPSDQVTATIERLEQYHFNEQLEISDMSRSGCFFTMQGPKSLAVLAAAQSRLVAGLGSENSCAEATLWQYPVMVVRKSITGEEGFFFWVNISDRENFQSKLVASATQGGLTAVSSEALRTARIEAGIPLFGEDISRQELLPDTVMEESTVSYSKGCYPGQEVIARIKTYSAPRKGLVGLVAPEGQRLDLPSGASLSTGGKEAGSIRSSCYSPMLERTIALAYVNREQRAPGTILDVRINDQIHSLTVTMLPFYRSVDVTRRARSLYDDALAAFAGDRTAQAISMLRECLQLDPLLADAYEALGVILSKQDELDEAIALMKKLSEIDPQCVMAHTNLSIFHMQQGNKEAAEEEKAIAMSIRMEQLAKEMSQQRQQEQEKQQKLEEAESRIAMFQQILEIDAEDQLANYGLGNLYAEIGEFEKAIPLLKKALDLKPNHTVAYLALGKSHAGMNNAQKASEVFKKGVEVAAKQGDMTPLKEMQQHLNELAKSGSPG